MSGLLLAFAWDWAIDGWIVMIGALAAIASSLLGCFLVLRKMSMLGDAITHAVLPGIAVAFYVTESRSSLPMFLGAIMVGILTTLLTEWIRGFGGVDEGASMGVVFTSLFALGLLIMRQTAHNVDLDPSCVLFGKIEFTPFDKIPIGQWQVPRAAAVLGVVVILNAGFVFLFFKELMLTSFDPALATSTGFSARWIQQGLMVLVSVTAVACFESVGSILVVAMFVVPSASAYLLTDRLGWMIAIAVVLAAASSLCGHLMAMELPPLLGYPQTTTAAMIAVASGLFFATAFLFAPRHGVLVRWVRRRVLALSILCDDVVAVLFRGEESGVSESANESALAKRLLVSRWSLKVAVLVLGRRAELDRVQSTSGTALRLTESGRERGKRLVRSHRLWEQYLVDQAGSGTERIHGKAERYEHFTDRTLREALANQTDRPELDPHGTPIPEEGTETDG
ncbi:MAG: metal ABC transporter permease [Planctomycetota bacterium]